MNSSPDRLVGADGEMHHARAFATGGSQRPAFQEARDEAQADSIQPDTVDAAGRSLSTNPIILRDLPSHADTSPTQAQLNRLHRSLTQRDLVLLQCLYDYRYLNTFQVKELFFPSLRACQMRLQVLRQHGLIYRWKVVETPGVTRRASLLLISARGARVLANLHGDNARTYVERSHDARDHCWHATHDLEANQFFVGLAAASRGRVDEGLLLWYGEAFVRADRRELALKYHWPVPTPDGMGVFPGPAGRILFDLEWDRATESTARLRQKIRSYVGYFEHFQSAELHHVLLVVPSDDREEALHRAIWRERPRFSRACCTFWSTTSYRLRQWGPLGAIWLSAKLRKDDPLVDDRPEDDLVSLRIRTAFDQLPPLEPNRRPAADCIGKPRWWERRPGGGQAA